LIVCSQGDSTTARATSPFVKSVQVVANDGIDGATGTDGLDVTSQNVGPGFEHGLLAVHDQANKGGTTSNLKYVPLDAILQSPGQ